MLTSFGKPIIQQLASPAFDERGLSVAIKREDLIHPEVSGNKWRKLKYNIEEANRVGAKTLLTFGGAYSNHIYATAAAAKASNMDAVGIIRGDELEKKPLNKTLTFAQENGMKLHFVAREVYAKKEKSSEIASIINSASSAYVLPEGGTNTLAIKGCQEILNEETSKFTHIAVSAGTGGTMTGIIMGASQYQNVVGFSALKGSFLKMEISSLLNQMGESQRTNWSLSTDYHFGGYAKTTPELMRFIDSFEQQHSVPLDQVYTGKMMFGVMDMIKRGQFKKGDSILCIHTGGLQGKH